MKERNTSNIDPVAYTGSLLTKIEILVGLEKALVEMFNHNIDNHAVVTVQNRAFDTKEEIEAMLENIKDILIKKEPSEEEDE